MQVDLTDLISQYEVVPVSLSDPFKSIVVEPSTMELLKFLPIIGFIALLMTAILIKSKRFPAQAVDGLNKTNKDENIN
tara:strand:- start:229 stop:462 length:234 start_codon:yes stop_codon:yes gene_type:complete